MNKKDIKNSRRALINSVPTYVKIGFKNNEAPPLNAPNLNKMDEAIYLLTEAINSGSGGEVPAFADVKNSDSEYDIATFPTLLEIIDFIKTGIEGLTGKTRFINADGEVISIYDETSDKIASMKMIKEHSGGGLPEELDKHLDYSVDGEFSVFSKDKATSSLGSYYHMDDEGITFGVKNDPIFSITEVAGVKKIDAFGNVISNIGDGVVDTDGINFKQYTVVVNQVQKFNADGEVINETYDPTNTPKDPSSQKMIEDEVSPLKDKTQNLDEDGNVISDVFDPDATPQALPTQKQVKENSTKWDYDAKDNKIINAENPTDPQDVSTKGYTDGKITPLTNKTQNLDARGRVVSTQYDPIRTPQAIATQKNIKDNIKGSGLGSLETNYQNNLNLGQQNTQLDDLEIGERILYRDYSNKSLAAEHIIIDNTQKNLSIPNLNTWVNEYDFVVSENGKYNVKQLFYFKLLFTSDNKKFRVGSAVHNATTGIIKGEIEEDFDFSNYTNDEIKEHIFNWFKQVNVDLTTGSTYVFRMTLQGLDSSAGTFSPIVDLSAGDVYELAEKSHFEISKLESKNKPPARENMEFQMWNSQTSAGGGDNALIEIKHWTVTPEKTNKDLFEYDNTTARFHPKLYLVELANNSIDGIWLEVEFNSNGFTSNRSDFFTKLETDFQGIVEDNYLTKISYDTSSASYLSTNSNVFYKVVIKLPKTIQTTDSFKLLKKAIDVSQADFLKPYNLLITNLYLTGVKGDKGDDNPARTKFSKTLTTITNGSEAFITLAPESLDAYRNLQVSSYIDALSLGEQNLVVLDWEDHSKYIILRVSTSEVVFAEHYSIYVYKNQATNQIKIVNKTGSDQEFTVAGSGVVI